jgi:23S rRNA (cytidine1920-2'-O)/16S rRNA (cytidine1409-2'-O)-methyltransferase
MKQNKDRLDKRLFELGLAESRQKAQALIMSGRVFVDEKKIDKAGTLVKETSVLRVKGGLEFASRGGLKLKGALRDFNIDVSGLTLMDVGASTGGFTDCLLKNGADSVLAIDVGKGLIDFRLRSDERVSLLESMNIRHLTKADIPEGFDTIDMAVIDVSFISIMKVIPKVREFIRPGGLILTLVKPQFEVGKGEVGKGGIVRDAAKHMMVLEKLKAFFEDEGFTIKGVSDSPITGAKGNKEFFMLLSCRD